MSTAVSSALAAAADAKSSGGLSPVAGAVIAATAALLGALIGAGASWFAQRRKEQVDALRASEANITEQLAKLYGPLRLLTEQSAALAEKLREGKPRGWHLLDHLPEVIGDAVDGALAEQIIAVDVRIEEQIFAHAGLLKDGDVSASLVDVLGHIRCLSLAYEGVKANRAATGGFTAKRFERYPQQFDDDVKAAYDELVADREALRAGLAS